MIPVALAKRAAAHPNARFSNSTGTTPTRTSRTTWTGRDRRRGQVPFGRWVNRRGGHRLMTARPLVGVFRHRQPHRCIA
jgi:hypothetical protein